MWSRQRSINYRRTGPDELREMPIPSRRFPADRTGAAVTRPKDPGRSGVPRELVALLASPEGPEREAAWRHLVNRHSRLIMSTVRALSADHDEAMDLYAFVLEGLRADNYGRLRSFAEQGAGRFEPWLVVVTRRLSIDYRRSRYGRRRRTGRTEASDDPGRSLRVVERRRLLDLVTEELDVARTADPSGANPEAAVRRRELRAALMEAIGSLETRDRLLLRLRFEDGRTAREIQDAMGFPSQFHVYRRLKKVFVRLRSKLEDLGVSDSTP